MTHEIKVTIDSRDGLTAALVCVDHDDSACSAHEAFYWDVPNAMEQYIGEPIEFPAIPVHVVAAGEDEGFQWQRPPKLECPHWAPGRITLRDGCTACEATVARSNEPIGHHAKPLESSPERANSGPDSSHIDPQIPDRSKK